MKNKWIDSDLAIDWSTLPGLMDEEARVAFTTDVEATLALYLHGDVELPLDEVWDALDPTIVKAFTDLN
jgi:hypothetical protein